MTPLDTSGSSELPYSVDDASVRALLQQADLALLPGGVLMARRDKALTPVGSRAHQYLFDSVALHSEVRLRDVFLLLEGDDLLQSVLRRDFAQEILQHVQPFLRAPLKPVVYEPQAIEYLELYAHWYQDSSTGQLHGTDLLHLHGVGFELKEALDEGHGCVYEAGSRIPWSISLSDPVSLLDLPLRVRDTVDVIEDDLDSSRYGSSVRTVAFSGMTLAQLMHGVLYELSFHGTPAQTQAFADTLREQVDDIKAGTAETHEVDLDELIYDDDNIEPLSAFFECWTPLRSRQVHSVLRWLDDELPAQAALQAELGKSVVLLPTWQAATCHELRRAIRLYEREHRRLRKQAKP